MHDSTTIENAVYVNIRIGSQFANPFFDSCKLSRLSVHDLQEGILIVGENEAMTAIVQNGLGVSRKPTTIVIVAVLKLE